MAITPEIIHFLKREYLGDILTLGRQDLCGSRRWVTTNAALKESGATSVRSLDLPEERPDYAKDLNAPFQLDHLFDVVFDGGTLEHIFNIPVALSTVSRLLKVGGVFCSHQILNLSGHGFYSLTPELLFSWFNANGFADCRCFVRSKFPFMRRWRELKWENKRIELTGVLPFEMWFRAQKVMEVETFTVPQQSGPSLTNRWKFLFYEARLFRWPRLFNQ